MALMGRTSRERACAIYMGDWTLDSRSWEAKGFTQQLTPVWGSSSNPCLGNGLGVAS